MQPPGMPAVRSKRGRRAALLLQASLAGPQPRRQPRALSPPESGFARSSAQALRKGNGHRKQRRTWSDLQRSPPRRLGTSNYCNIARSRARGVATYIWHIRGRGCACSDASTIPGLLGPAQTVHPPSRNGAMCFFLKKKESFKMPIVTLEVTVAAVHSSGLRSIFLWSHLVCTSRIEASLPGKKNRKS